MENDALKDELRRQGIVYHDAGGALQLGPQELDSGPCSFGLACCAIEMIATSMPATIWRGSARKSSGPPRAKRT